MQLVYILSAFCILKCGNILPPDTINGLVNDGDDSITLQYERWNDLNDSDHTDICTIMTGMLVSCYLPFDYIICTFSQEKIWFCFYQIIPSENSNTKEMTNGFQMVYYQQQIQRPNMSYHPFGAILNFLAQ